ncbi:40S ribosomal protein S17-like [Lontra canadensis]|uniref:40S ribosomal protein S17-like n=1 Tax=Lontra canadensis TaxID=76717 RepID=UPI0013F31D2B|nr:40S ribosomal protein S17-like [Lontra canadensis]
MGYFCSKTMRKVVQVITEKYYSRLSNDFHTNNTVCGDIAVMPSKKLCSKIAGWLMHLMGWNQRGLVRGICIKLQEERGRKDNYVPEVSALEQEIIAVDPDAKEPSKPFFGILDKLQVSQPATGMNFKTPRGVV